AGHTRHGKRISLFALTMSESASLLSMRRSCSVVCDVERCERQKIWVSQDVGVSPRLFTLNDAPKVF
ncbi:hypothetical protein, partial [Oleiphilus sp. HI0066]|uniref:hypothetical protein n=1 Tax=Oleiphilus sp. HI0066 TaxID=1822242 RepID=UPI001E28A124